MQYFISHEYCQDYIVSFLFQNTVYQRMMNNNKGMNVTVTIKENIIIVMDTRFS